MSEIQGINKSESKKIKDSATVQLGARQVRDAIQNTILQWKSQGIQDWEILDIWANLAHQQGNDAVADSLESVAYELGKPIE